MGEQLPQGPLVITTPGRTAKQSTTEAGRNQVTAVGMARVDTTTAVKAKAFIESPKIMDDARYRDTLVGMNGFVKQADDLSIAVKHQILANHAAGISQAVRETAGGRHEQ